MNSEDKQRLKVYIELEQHIAIISKNHDCLDDILLQLQNKNLIFTIDLMSHLQITKNNPQFKLN